MSKNLVIVESPAKAKTIEKYLGADFQVLSSVGHIRKDTKVDVDHNFAVTYEIDPDHKKVVSQLKKAAAAAETIWLATDEDREGESISWHLQQVLKLTQDTRRITFHEITKPALEAAIQNPRTVDMNMVSSQQTRQTLDMLVGYDLSGVVRRKVPGAISAGRVQSPALRLIVEKEREIADFDQKFNFKVSGTFGKPEFTANLEKPFPETADAAKELLENLASATFTVSAIDQTEGNKANPVPLTTAALQIEANSKLGFSASTTMRAAQALYQAGMITYHRTDSLNLSNQALGQIANYIEKTYGKNYLQTRHFKTKSASAQEAHEAIRPTDITRITAGKNDFEKKLYNLIRTRTLATQMANAKVAKTTVTLVPDARVASPEGDPQNFGEENRGRTRASSSSSTDVVFLAKGEIVIFDGFLKVYGKNKDSELPPLTAGQTVEAHEIVARQTFAKPPARYTEGSLVKKLEELGIGRPSTYASIMSALQTRGYVRKGEGEGRERKVLEIALTKKSAEEAAFDGKNPDKPAEVTNSQKLTTGELLLERTTSEKSGATKGKLLPTPVGELLSDFLTHNFADIVDYNFTAHIEDDLDLIAAAKLERVKMLRDFYGPFSKTVAKAADTDRYNGARELGIHPDTKEPIFAKIGKNGGFIQLGLNEKESGKKPRFAPLPKNTDTKTVTLEQALKQLELPQLPRSLGKAKDGTEIIAASGPFGPYLKAGKYNISIKGQDPYTITLEEALPLYQAKIDSIIADWGEIMIINGAYGPYIKGPGRRNNLRIPKETNPKSITESQAREMLENKPKTRRRAPRRGHKK